MARYTAGDSLAYRHHNITISMALCSQCRTARIGLGSLPFIRDAGKPRTSRRYSNHITVSRIITQMNLWWVFELRLVIRGINSSKQPLAKSILDNCCQLHSFPPLYWLSTCAPTPRPHAKFFKYCPRPQSKSLPMWIWNWDLLPKSPPSWWKFHLWLEKWLVIVINMVRCL